MTETRPFPPIPARTSRTWSLPNMLTYGRILAVPAIVLCFYLENYIGRWLRLRSSSRRASPTISTAISRGLWQQHSALGRMLDPIADKLLVATTLLLLVSDGTIGGWSLLAAIVILTREIAVSGLREFLAELRVSVPVTRLAKWKTTMQMVALGFLLAGPAGDRIIPLDDLYRTPAPLDVGAGDALHRLRLFPGGPPPPCGGRLKLVYFAWVRERIGLKEEEIALPGGVATVGRSGRVAEDARTGIRARACRAVGDPRRGRPRPCRAARRRSPGASEVALFPPMTGG